jgi:hypothetical protein
MSIVIASPSAVTLALARFPDTSYYRSIPRLNMAKLYNNFYKRLPVRVVRVDEHLHLLNEEEIRHIRRSERLMMLAAAGLSMAGFLSYYLPIYKFPDLFPFVNLTIPIVGTTIKLPWAELLWCLFLTSIELTLLTLINIAGVHEIAVATGFVNAETKTEREEALLGIGLEKKNVEVIKYGIDPFQGLNKWMLFLFNVLLRLKGWLGNQVIRYLVRTMLGRYAVRSVLDFSGMPLYMAINAYSVYAVLRQARVIILGQTAIALLLKRLPERSLSEIEKDLLYDTLQYIAISKRDFHQNHYVLTKDLLKFFNIPPKEKHLLPDDYLDKLSRAPSSVLALCQIVILLGFILDGHISGRERFRIHELNSAGALKENASEVKTYMRNFLTGAGIEGWVEAYLSRMSETSQVRAGESFH